MEKSQGEGSRGGKVVGHTRSGKPIYEGKSNASHMKDRASTEHGQIVPGAKSKEHHKEYSIQDHMDAMHFHEAEHKKASSETAKERHHRAMRYHDDEIIEQHGDAPVTDEQKQAYKQSKEHYLKEDSKKGK